jgi:hypothetical protein
VDTVPFRELQTRVSAHARNVGEWLGGWRDGLVRFDAERSLPRAQWSDTTQHRHDWVGLLHLRDIIESDIRRGPAPLPDAVRSWLDQVDDFLRSFTEEVRDWSAEEASSGEWWWQRLPVDGPVRAGWWAHE